MAPGAIELPDDVDLDYFDRHDLGRLRRRLRTAVRSRDGSLWLLTANGSDDRLLRIARP